jgi:hypothetical protein
MIKRYTAIFFALIFSAGLLYAGPVETVTNRGHLVGQMGLEIAKGSVPGHEIELKFGDSEFMTTAERTIWGLNVDNNYFLPSPQQIKITSSDVDDTASGAGARQLVIFYLDENGWEATETISLNGQTEVTTVALMSAVNRVMVKEAGATGYNEGVIYLFVGTSTLGVPDDSTTIVNGITIDHNQTTSSFYTVPSNKTAYIVWGLGGAAANKTLSVKFRVKDNGVFRTSLDFDAINDMILFPLIDTPLVAKSGAQLRVTGQLDTGGGRASATWGMILIENSRLGL